jgi:hypothetical protein
LGGHEFWSVLLVENVNFGNAKACGGQQVNDRSVEVATPENPLLHGFEPVLPTAHSLVWG